MPVGHFVKGTPVWTPLYQPVRRARPPGRTHSPKPPSSRPFFKEPGHRIPTIRLFRSLLRATRPGIHDHARTLAPAPPIVQEGQPGPGPSTVAAAATAPLTRQPPLPVPGRTRRKRRPLEGVRRELIYTWHRARRLVAPVPVRLFLTRQMALLSLLQRHPLPRSLLKLNRHILSLHPPRRPRARKPWLTGHWVRPTLYNPPFPRMRPQPIHLSRMIGKRIQARARRIQAMRLAEDWFADMQMEVAFWRRLGRGPLEDGWGGWDLAEYTRAREEVGALFQKENRRAEIQVSAAAFRRVDKFRKKRMNEIRIRSEKRKKREREAEERAQARQDKGGPTT